MRKRKTVESAVKAVTKYLGKFALNGAEVDIYYWIDPMGGFRAQEVSFATASGGAAFMASDPDSLGVCAAVERCVVALLEGEDIALRFEILDWFFRE